MCCSEGKDDAARIEFLGATGCVSLMSDMLAGATSNTFPLHGALDTGGGTAVRDATGGGAVVSNPLKASAGPPVASEMTCQPATESKHQTADACSLPGAYFGPS